jgi:methanol--5-hydroxybenzimidazolylcobamide Co-methyltransferase
MKYRNLTITDPNQLIFGSAPHPVTSRRGLIFGGGHVYPEVNLTVPAGTVINKQTLPELAGKYAQAARGILQRCLELEAHGVVIEFETLLEMTLEPEIGTEITKRMNEICEEYYQKYGLGSEIRLTPNDTRDFDRPPRMRTGSYLDNMLTLFRDGATAGGDILSIETTGGKEVCDDALTMCDTRAMVFALAVLGVRDMKFIWRKIVEIGKAQGKIIGGDTACGFANTAMVLAEKHYIPRIFAAMVRIVSVVRSLVAVEEGAVGPDKDCGYEGIYLKAITGIPISMEGKTAACAHLSPLGNIAGVAADLWSNESVQNIKLLGGMAPTVYAEQLEYDCRLMNTSIIEGKDSALQLRNLMVESDIHLDPQALILAPDQVISISQEIVKSGDYLQGAVAGALKGLEIIENAINNDALKLPEMEMIWIDRIRGELQSIPDNEDQFIEEMLPALDLEKVVLAEYGIE